MLTEKTLFELKDNQIKNRNMKNGTSYLIKKKYRNTDATRRKKTGFLLQKRL